MLVFFTIKTTKPPASHSHSHDFHEFFYCLKGKGYQYTDSAKFKTKEGELYFFPAGQNHCGSSREKGEHFGQVTYLPVNYFPSSQPGETDAFNTLKALERNALSGSNRIDTTPDTAIRLRSLFDELSAETESRRKGFHVIQRSIMQRLLIEILRGSDISIEHTEENSDCSADSRITDFCQFVDANFQQKIAVERATSITGLSRSHFHAAFRKVTGKTLVEYINDLRTQKVISLLRTSSMPSSEIAKTCGFLSLSHMYYVIRKATGKNPRLIRRDSQSVHSAVR